MSPASEQPKGRRSADGHVRMACTRCRNRKGRCDGNKPSCAACLRTNQPCIYEHVSIEDTAAARRYKLELKLRRQAEAVSQSSDSSSPTTKGKGRAATISTGSSRSIKGTAATKARPKVRRHDTTPSATSAVQIGTRRRSVSVTFGANTSASASVQLSRLLQGSDAPAGQALAHLTTQIDAAASTSLSAPNSPQLATTAHFASMGLQAPSVLGHIDSYASESHAAFHGSVVTAGLYGLAQPTVFSAEPTSTIYSSASSSSSHNSAESPGACLPIQVGMPGLAEPETMGLGLVVGAEAQDWDVSMRRLSLMDCHAASFYRRVSIARAAQAGTQGHFAGSNGVEDVWAATTYSQLAGRRASRALPPTEIASNLSGFHAWQTWLQGAMPSSDTASSDILRVGADLSAPLSSVSPSADGSTPHFGGSTPGDSSSSAAPPSSAAGSPPPLSSWPIELPVSSPEAGARGSHTWMSIPRPSISWTFEDVSDNVRRLSIDPGVTSVRFAPYEHPAFHSPTVVPSERLSPMFENLDFWDSKVGLRMSMSERRPSALFRSTSSDNVAIRRPSIMRFASQYDHLSAPPVFQLPSWKSAPRAPQDHDHFGPMGEAYHA